MDIERKINEIESKIKRVAAERDDYQHHNFVLLDENKQLKSELAKQSDLIYELQQRLAESQQILTKEDGENLLQKDSLSEKDTEALKKQIDQYIQEIDKCIEWLQNS